MNIPIFCVIIILKNKGGLALMYPTQYVKQQNSDEVLSMLTSIFNTSYDGLFVCDCNGYPLFYNDALLQITGLTSEFLSSAIIFEALKMKAVPNVGAAVALGEKRRSTIIVDYPHGKKALITATPYFDEKQRILFVVSNLRDITEINRIQKKLEAPPQSSQVYQETLDQFHDELEKRQQVVYKSKSMDQVISLARRLAENDSPVLLLGESGVGKDVLANYIHDCSKRSGPFIKINCGAIPDHLLESELFGYEKGAFTGATHNKKGIIELANGGTLFLDEIGDLPYTLQVKLLNVLQDYKIRRLGGTFMKKVDVRIITATNIDLESHIKQKKFRLDLYYRLNVLSITIPPLRERKEDIPDFVFYFLQTLENKYKTKKKVSNLVLQKFMEYSWPGNIRELKNIVERLYHLSEGPMISIEDIPNHIHHDRHSIPCMNNKDKVKEKFPSLKEATNLFEKDYIARMLEQTSSLQECANQLGISLSTLVRKKRNLK